MSADIKIPMMGESISEATIGQWLKREGDAVRKGEPVVELETEKANVEIAADVDGVLEKIVKAEGDTVTVGDVVGVIDDSPTSAGQKRPAASATAATGGRAAPAAPAEADDRAEATPVARKLAEERGIDLAQLRGSGRGGKITREDVEALIDSADGTSQAAEPAKTETAAAPTRPAQARAEAPPQKRPEPTAQAGSGGRPEERVRQSRRRQTIARRLVEAHQTAVMTTTYNEIDMSQVVQLRKRRREEFKQQFGIDLGFMSFFVKAVVAGLKAYPRLNASLDGEDVVLKKYYDIGIAVASEEGLVVPVLRDADQQTFAGIEKAIAGMVQRTRDRKLTLEELTGGTFTITNGGVFGSLFSTPILNPPQVGILGMHRAIDRPIAVDGKVEVRSMMYAALTYDHRVVDGADAVRFLARVKSVVEDPGSLLLAG